MSIPILVVTSRYPREIEDRINRDYEARRNPKAALFSREELLAVSDGADALFITLLTGWIPSFSCSF